MPGAKKVHVRARREPAPFVTKTVNERSWKPQTSWIIVLRKDNGERDVRSFKGSYEDAALRRDEYLYDSLHASSAWLIEERDRGRFKPKKEERVS